jgi:hypothetical protein
MMNPAPQTPHFVSPENRYCGRFAAPMARCLHCVPSLFLTRLRSSPKVVRNDPKLRDFPRHPLGCWVEPRHSLSGVGILHIAKAIPDQAADVEFVVEDAGSTRRS